MRKRERSESPANLHQNPRQRRAEQGADLLTPNFITPEKIILEKLESILHSLRNHSSMPGQQQILNILNNTRTALTTIVRDSAESQTALHQLYVSNLQFLRVIDEIEESLSSCEGIISQMAVLNAEIASDTANASEEASDKIEAAIEQICNQISWHAQAATPLIERAETLKDGIIRILERNFEDSDGSDNASDSSEDADLKPLEARFTRWNEVMITAIREIYQTQQALQQPKDDFGLRVQMREMRHDFKKFLQDFTKAMKKFERMHMKLLRYSGETVESPDPTPPASPEPSVSSSSCFFSCNSRSPSRTSQASENTSSPEHQRGNAM